MICKIFPFTRTPQHVAAKTGCFFNGVFATSFGKPFHFITLATVVLCESGVCCDCVLELDSGMKIAHLLCCFTCWRSSYRTSPELGQRRRKSSLVRRQSAFPFISNFWWSARRREYSLWAQRSQRFTSSLFHKDGLIRSLPGSLQSSSGTVSYPKGGSFWGSRRTGEQTGGLFPLQFCWSFIKGGGEEASLMFCNLQDFTSTEIFATILIPDYCINLNLSS